MTYLDLVARGVQFHDLVCDGGTELRAGVREAELAIPFSSELFVIPWYQNPSQNALSG
jgi:hypothetical protein